MTPGVHSEIGPTIGRTAADVYRLAREIGFEARRVAELAAAGKFQDIAAAERGLARIGALLGARSGDAAAEQG